MKTKYLILIFTILLAITLSVAFISNVKADTTGTLYPQTYPIWFTMVVAIDGNFIGQTVSTIYDATNGEITADIIVDTPIWLNTGETLTVSFKDCADTTMRTDSLFTGPGYINPSTWTAHFNVATSSQYTNDDGSTYAIDYTLYSSGTYVSGVSTTPYFYVTVNSAYGSPTSSQYVAQGGSLTVSVATPTSLGAGTQVICTGNTYDSASSYSFTNIQEDKSITFNWQLQYQVTYVATGLDGTASGTVITVDGTPIAYGSLSYVKWMNYGAATTFTYASTVASSNAHQRFTLTSSVASPQTITGPTTISGGYTLGYYQALVTFNPTGINGSATGTIVTVDGTAVSYASLPYTKWVDIGGSITFTYTSTVTSNIDHYQFILTNTYSSPQTITGTTSLNAIYVLSAYEKQITFAQTGLDSSAQGTVVTVNGVPKTYAQLPYSYYANIGDTVTYSWATPITSNLHDHQQFTLTTNINSFSPFTVSGTQTVTGAYALSYYQYSVTVSQSGLDSTVGTNTIVTVDGVAKTWSALSSGSYIYWVNTGSSVTYTYSSTITSSTTGKQFLSYYATPPVTLTIYSNTQISNTYLTQYYLNVTSPHSSGLGSGWYNAGSQATCTVAQISVSGSTNTQYAFASWTGTGTGSYTGTNSYPTFTMNAPITETAVWVTQYYVLIDGVYATSTGSGWYTAGTTASFSVANATGSGGVRVGFSSWTGVGSGSYTGSLQSSSCTVNAPITETASWVTQYYLTVSSPYGTTTGTDWYTNGATAYAGLTSSTVTVGSTTRYSFLSWSSGGTNATQSTAITMTAPTTITASWSTQYYLTVTSAYATPTGANWYNVGATAYAGLNTATVGLSTFQGWAGGASGGTYAQSGVITMTGPKTALAVWSTSTTGGGGTPSYNVTLMGPYNEDGSIPSTTTLSYTLSFANSSVYSNTMTSGVGVANTTYIASTSPFMQLTWNSTSISATYNSTRIFRFANGANAINDTIVRLYIVPSDKPSFVYTFSVSDYYGMNNPYMQTSVSPDGTTSYPVERVALSESGGYIQFVMTQNQIYTISFICQQGTYSKSFTPQTIGQPGQLAINENVLAGNFPVANTTGLISTYATRVNNTGITVSYSDPNATTTWVNIAITHKQGATAITDYTTNVTGSTQSFTWDMASTSTDYTVIITNNLLQTWNLPVNSESGTNPWTGLLDFLGTTTNTLPATYTGWGGIDPAQLIAAALIMAALGIGSFYSTTASMIIAWAIAGILLKLGWWQGSVPLFVLAIVFTALVAIDEYKKGAINI
jgi:hypothetical protein